MRVRTLAVSAALGLAGLSPASAQLSGGVGSSNAANQAFQQQNSFRAVQAQQTFTNNQTTMQIQRNQLYNGAGGNGGGAYLGRRYR